MTFASHCCTIQEQLGAKNSSATSAAVPTLRMHHFLPHDPDIPYISIADHVVVALQGGSCMILLQFLLFGNLE
jgi:hypothetical protein